MLAAHSTKCSLMLQTAPSSWPKQLFLPYWWNPQWGCGEVQCEIHAGFRLFHVVRGFFLQNEAFNNAEVHTEMAPPSVWLYSDIEIATKLIAKVDASRVFVVASNYRNASYLDNKFHHVACDLSFHSCLDYSEYSENSHISCLSIRLQLNYLLDAIKTSSTLSVTPEAHLPQVP